MVVWGGRHGNRTVLTRRSRECLCNLKRGPGVTDTAEEAQNHQAKGTTKKHKVGQWSCTLGVVGFCSTHLYDLYFHKCMPCAMCSSPKQGHQPWLCITSKKVSDSQNYLQPCHVAQPTWTKVVPPTWSLYVTPCAHEVAHSAAKLCLV